MKLNVSQPLAKMGDVIEPCVLSFMVIFKTFCVLTDCDLSLSKMGI